MEYTTNIFFFATIKEYLGMEIKPHAKKPFFLVKNTP